MKHKLTNILIASILASTIGLSFVFAPQNVNKNELVVEAETIEQYYSDITDGMAGTTLLNALNTLNSKKRKKTIGYAGMRYFAAKSDADPDGSGKIIGFYDNKKVGPAWDSGNTWNREHVWPNIRGGSAVEDDAHMTRPASTATNSDRGSKGYGMSSYDPGQFVPYYRGAAARIIFYAAIADTSLNLIDDPLNYHGGNPANSMGSLSEMLKWNLQYKPSDTSFTGDNDLARRTEINRNNVIQNDSSGQGNRNPFIDHPEYACKIWGNYNSATKAVCGSQPDPVNTTVTLSSSSIALNYGESKTISATSSEGDSISWTTNSDVITFSKTKSNSSEAITITANKPGTATITAKNNYDGSATCKVTVASKTGTEVFLTFEELTLKVGETAEICGVSTESDEIHWAIDNDHVSINKTVSASAEDITIIALSKGETVLTAANSFDGFSACLIKVIEEGSGEETSESSTSEPTSSSDNGSSGSETESSEEKQESKNMFGCGGYLAISSTAIFTISLMGIVFFIRKRKQ